MFKRDEYPQRLAEIGLTKDQTKKLRAVLEEMMTYAARKGNNVKYTDRGRRKLTDQEDRFVQYCEGRSDGINSVDRFLRGDMDAHDEFPDED